MGERCDPDVSIRILGGVTTCVTRVMGGKPDSAAIEMMARQYLESGSFGDRFLRDAAAIAVPRLVVGPRGEPHSWLVGLTVGDRLAAGVPALLDGFPMWDSSFPGQPGDVTRCPPAADWLDPATVRKRAATAQRGRVIEEPFLTFDRNPDRVVWAVRVQDSNGQQRMVFVAGDAVYEPPTSPTFG